MYILSDLIFLANVFDISTYNRKGYDIRNNIIDYLLKNIESFMEIYNDDIIDIIFLAKIFDIDSYKVNENDIKDYIIEYLLENVKYLLDISDDEIINVILHSPIQTILKISGTNRRLNDLLKSDYIWKYLIDRDFQIFAYETKDLSNRFFDNKSLYKYLYERKNIIEYLLNKYDGIPITSSAIDLIQRFIGLKPSLLDIIYDVHKYYFGITNITTFNSISQIFYHINSFAGSDIDTDLIKIYDGRNHDVTLLERAISNFGDDFVPHFDLLIDVFYEKEDDIKIVLDNYLPYKTIVYFSDTEDNIIPFESSMNVPDFDDLDILSKYFYYLDRILLYNSIVLRLDPIIIDIFYKYRDSFFDYYKKIKSNFSYIQ